MGGRSSQGTRRSRGWQGREGKGNLTMNFQEFCKLRSSARFTACGGKQRSPECVMCMMCICMEKYGLYIQRKNGEWWPQTCKNSWFITLKTVYLLLGAPLNPCIQQNENLVCLLVCLSLYILLAGLDGKSQRVSYCTACSPPKQRHLRYASKFLTGLGLQLVECFLYPD